MPGLLIAQMSDKINTDRYVPGMWKCKTCGFTQQNSVICPKGVYANDKVNARPCPNDGDVMFPVTWQELADKNQAFGVRMLDEREATIKTLLEIEGLGCISASRLAREAIDRIYPGANFGR